MSKEILGWILISLLAVFIIAPIIGHHMCDEDSYWLSLVGGLFIVFGAGLCVGWGYLIVWCFS